MTRSIATGPKRVMRSVGNVRPETVHIRASLKLVSGSWVVIPPTPKLIEQDYGIPRIH